MENVSLIFMKTAKQISPDKFVLKKIGMLKGVKANAPALFLNSLWTIALMSYLIKTEGT